MAVCDFGCGVQCVKWHLLYCTHSNADFVRIHFDVCLYLSCLLKALFVYAVDAIKHYVI